MTDVILKWGNYSLQWKNTLISSSMRKYSFKNHWKFLGNTCFLEYSVQLCRKKCSNTCVHGNIQLIVWYKFSAGTCINSVSFQCFSPTRNSTIYGTFNYLYAFNPKSLRGSLFKFQILFHPCCPLRNNLLFLRRHTNEHHWHGICENSIHLLPSEDDASDALVKISLLNLCKSDFLEHKRIFHFPKNCTRQRISLINMYC